MPNMVCLKIKGSNSLIERKRKLDAIVEKSSEDDVAVDKKVLKLDQVGIGNGDSYFAEMFLKMLQDETTAFKGMEKFCALSSIWKKSSKNYDVVDHFLALGSCDSIAQHLNPLTGPANVILICKSLTAIFVRTASDLKKKNDYSMKVEEFCCSTMKNSLNVLWNLLNRGNLQLTMSILDMFSAMVIQKFSVGIMLLKYVEMMKSRFMSLSRCFSNENSQDQIRLGMIRFAVSYLLGSAKLAVSAIASDLFSNTFRQLHKERKALNIHLLLSSFLDKVVTLKLVGKIHLRRLFTSNGVLTSLALLLDWDGVVDLSSYELPSKIIDKSIIHRLAFQFLSVLCCSTKFGIIAANSYEENINKSSNDYLLSFLLNMKEKISATPLAITLVAKIFAALPCLIRQYFNSSALNLEPVATIQWFNNMHFIQEVYNHQPSFPQILHVLPVQLPKSSYLQRINLILPEIIAPSLDRSTLTLVISNPDSEVQLQGFKVITKALQSLKAAYDFLSKKRIANDFRISLLKAFKQHIPTVNTIMNTLKAIFKLGRNDELEVEGLKMLLLLQEVFFGSFVGGKAIDFYDLFFALAPLSSTATGSQSILFMLDILKKSSNNYKWFTCARADQVPLFSLLLHFTVDLMQKEGNQEIINKALQLCVKVADDHHIINPNDSAAEYHTWMHSLCKNSTGGDEKFLTEKNDCRRFFTRIVVAAANEPSKASSMMKSIQNSLIKENMKFNSSSGVETVVTKSNFAQYLQECGISTLLLSSIHELNFVDSSSDNWNFNEIEKFLCCVITDLFHRQVFKSNLQQFSVILTSLISKIADRSYFPHLSQLSNELNEHRLALDFYNDHFTVIDGFNKENAHDWKVKQDTSIKCLDESIPSTICSEHGIILLENWIAFVLFNLTNLAAMSSLDEQEIQQSFDNVFGKLYNFVKNAQIEDLEVETVNNECQLPCSPVAFNLSANFFILKGDFVQLMQKILKTNVVQRLFLNISHKESISNLSNDFIIECLSIMYPLSNESVPSVYKHKISQAVLKLNTSANEPEMSYLEEIVYKSFEKLFSYLDETHLLEILQHAAHIACTESDSRAIAIASKCLERLTAINSVNFPVSVIPKLFEILINLKEEDLISFYLSCLGHLLKEKALFALYCKDEVIDWCVDHYFDKKAMDLLQNLLLFNPALLHHFLQISSHQGKHSLSSKSSLGRKKLGRVLSSLINCPHLCAHETDNCTLQTLITNVYAQKLITYLFNNGYKLKKYQVEMLLLLINNNHLSTEATNKLCTQLPSTIEKDFQFSKRWKIVSAFLVYTETTYEQTKHNTFCLQLINSLMLLSCELLQNSLPSLQDVSIALNQLLLNVCQFQPSLILKNANLELWKRYLKLALKFHLDIPYVLTVALGLVKLHKHIGESYICSRLYKRITKCSKFSEIMLTDCEQENCAKFPLLQLLFELLLDCDKRFLKSSDFSFLLPSYNGSLSKSDILLYKIMQLYEFKEVYCSKYEPFLWGKKSLEFYSESGNKESDATQVYHCLNGKMMKTTLAKFPISRQLPMKNQFQEQGDLSNNATDALPFDGSHVYDPAFLLSSLSSFFSSKPSIDCKPLIEHGLLSFLILCLASQCCNIRNLAVHCLLLFLKHVQTDVFNWKRLTLHVLNTTRSVVKSSDDHAKVTRLPTVVAHFLSASAQLIGKPNKLMFLPIFTHLCREKPFNADEIPTLDLHLFSHSKGREKRLSWILSLFSRGLRCEDDYKFAKDNGAFRVLMTYYESVLCSDDVKLLILNVIERVCSLRSSLVDLISKRSMLPWLRGIVKKCAGKQYIGLRSVFLIVKNIWRSLFSFEDWVMETDTLECIRVTALPQLYYLCFDVIGVITEAYQSSKYKKVEMLCHVNNLIKIAAEVSSDHRPRDGLLTSTDPFAISRHQRETLSTAALSIRNMNGHITEEVFQVVINWLPGAKYASDGRLFLSDMRWSLETWNGNTTHLMALLKWIRTGIETTNLIEGDADDVTALLSRSYKQFSLSPTTMTSQAKCCLDLFYAIFKLLLSGSTAEDADIKVIVDIYDDVYRGQR